MFKVSKGRKFCVFYFTHPLQKFSSAKVKNDFHGLIEHGCYSAAYYFGKKKLGWYNLLRNLPELNIANSVIAERNFILN